VAARGSLVVHAPELAPARALPPPEEDAPESTADAGAPPVRMAAPAEAIASPAAEPVSIRDPSSVF
jgi:hypothetical protein